AFDCSPTNRERELGLDHKTNLENAKKVKVAVSTVCFTIKRHSETWANSDSKRSGRPKATESEEKCLRVNNLRDRQHIGQQLQAQLNNGCIAGFTGRIAARKPLLRHQNKKKSEDWKKVLCYQTGFLWEDGSSVCTDHGSTRTGLEHESDRARGLPHQTGPKVQTVQRCP
uniref:Transposase Tc1-like domain-containing protein n=1 Tax=Mola mola TaxID=94237 RepID=A0A3Q3WTG3_MOLML